MCFPDPPAPQGPSEAEIAAAQAQRDAANRAKRDAIEEKARQKKSDLEDALERTEGGDGRRGATGRRSLMTAPNRTR